MNIISHIGKSIINLVNNMGRSVMFLYNVFLGMCRYGCNTRVILQQIVYIGVKSSFIVLLTGTFTGMVFALQTFYAFNKFGATTILGPVVALTLIRELGPVLTAVMVAARAGSALTAEIGSMKVTEQVDALEVMGIDPYAYILFPNMIAGLLVFPILTVLFDVIGIFGGCLVSVNILNVAQGSYFGEMTTYVQMTDIVTGLVKAVFFAFIVLWICLYMGYFTSGGAKGVSKSTRSAVVLSAVSIFVFDYVLTAILNSGIITNLF